MGQQLQKYKNLVVLGQLVIHRILWGCFNSNSRISGDAKVERKFVAFKELGL